MTMNRQMLRSKIHRISVTECDVEYEGSLTLDPQIMLQAGMVRHERIDVYNVDNANRFSTYLIEGDPGSGDCCVNGAAALLVSKGDRLILASYCTVEDEHAATHEPQVVLVGEGNRIKEVKNAERSRVRV
jgi:aspartate 1-decarboxylase